jgi:hypothetical protein
MECGSCLAPRASRRGRKRQQQYRSIGRARVAERGRERQCVKREGDVWIALRCVVLGRGRRMEGRRMEEGRKEERRRLKEMGNMEMKRETEFVREREEVLFLRSRRTRTQLWTTVAALQSAVQSALCASLHTGTLFLLVLLAKRKQTYIHTHCHTCTSASIPEPELHENCFVSFHFTSFRFLSSSRSFGALRGRTNLAQRRPCSRRRSRSTTHNTTQHHTTPSHAPRPSFRRCLYP